MTAEDIVSVFKCVDSRVSSPQLTIRHLLTDSRRLGESAETIFFAIPTKRNNGANYVLDLYARGVRNFVVPAELPEELSLKFASLDEANIWYVKDVVRSLQRIVTAHRRQFSVPVVGITGSNGKTIVKDWIVQLLASDRKLVSSPRSYNSQIGVPLSVWQMSSSDEMGVFEAGISAAGEMDNLREVILPTIGIFTNIGQAHDENFLTRYQKVAEKLQLFTHCDVLIYCTDHKEIHTVLSEKETLHDLNRFTWGTSDENNVRLLESRVENNRTQLRVNYEGEDLEFWIPFVDRASAENAMQCITLMLYLGYDGAEIARRCSLLTPVAMRLEMNEAVNSCTLVNDSYSLDLNSLTIALDFVLHDQRHYKKTLVLSDVAQSGLPVDELYAQVAQLINQHGITKLIGIGDDLCRSMDFFNLEEKVFYHNTEEFLHKHDFDSFQNETILLKGARKFHFEDIARVLQRKTHQTIMEVNLDALIHNLNFYRSRIRPTTRLMAMVKAASYGAGKVEIANALQFNHVDYLTVAYADEGVDLRRNGITLPIMVMNPEEESFDDIIRYQLEPDIYSFRIFDAFADAVSLLGTTSQKYPVHVELDTGMHRLGFGPNDIDQLIARFGQKDCVLGVSSVFSHLACSEDAEMDDFTRLQISRFTEWSGALKHGLRNEGICCHILNSSGITRFPEAQMDMVRLGIGLYGISPEADVQAQLQPVSRLKTRISQLKAIPKGDSVGYNRRWIAQQDSVIAILSIGYADGLNRHLGYGNGKVMVCGHEAPIIGSICMDMCFVDVTGIACSEGDEVVIFGDARLLQQISDAAGTIPYEILTSVSPRVKRVYFQES